MKRVLVTGASGFVGRSLVPALVHAGYAVRAALRRQGLFSDLAETVTVPDLHAEVDWKPILRDVDIVVHLAGLAHADMPVAFESFDRVNRIATQQLADASARAGVERFVFVSSVRAQSEASSDFEASEADKPRPTDSYGKTKLGGELAVIFSGVPFTIFRPVVIYGPNPKGNIKTLVRIASLPLPLPFGAFTNRRSLLGIDNFVHAILYALRTSETVGQTYLLADADPLTFRQILVTLRAGLKRRPALLPIPPAIVESALSFVGRSGLWGRLGKEMVVSTAKIRAAGWHPPVSTVDGLIAMVQAEQEYS